MQTLLVDSDDHRRGRWRNRLECRGLEVTTIAHCGEALDPVAGQRRYGVAIVAWTDADDWRDKTKDLLNQLRGKCQQLMCLVDRHDEGAILVAYSIGFDDCLPDKCSDQELTTKLDRVLSLERLDERLAKAQKLESIGELASGIAHEINTPIQYVGDNTRFVQGAYSDLSDVFEQCQTLIAAAEANEALDLPVEKLGKTLEDADLEYLQEEIPSAIQQTLEGVDRVANIVRAMKEFAHPGASELTRTDLAKAIENTAMVARNEWKYVADLQTDFDPELAEVPCLPGELNQVLLNMIVNAAHAVAESLGESPEERGKITVATRLAAPNAEIRISDSGCGISKDNLERIFTPFFTTKAAGKGTGQGLAIAHSVVVEKHGGTISVESVVGEGTTFIIRLPLESRVAANVDVDAAVDGISDLIDA